MMKPALKKNILIAVLCVLAVSVLAAALLLGGSNAQNPRQAVSDDGNIPASDTPSPAETSGTAAPSETEEVQYSPGKITRIYVYTTDRTLDTFVERYGEEHWDFDYRVLATTDQTTLYADDVFRLVK